VKAKSLRMIRAIDRRLPLPLASVRNARSLVGLPNLRDFIGTAMEHPAACGDGFLVSDRERLSTPQLLETIGTALGCPARLTPVPAAVLAAAARLLGWRVPFSLDEQSREAIDSYRRRTAHSGSRLVNPKHPT
jgi:nucleoside-diphosphate-sugar epimerase